MDESVFAHHVTSSKNDFYRWVFDIVKDYTLARQINRTISKQKMHRLVKQRIYDLEKESENVANIDLLKQQSSEDAERNALKSLFNGSAKIVKKKRPKIKPKQKLKFKKQSKPAVQITDVSHLFERQKTSMVTDVSHLFKKEAFTKKSSAARVKKSPGSARKSRVSKRRGKRSSTPISIIRRKAIVEPVDVVMFIRQQLNNARHLYDHFAVGNRFGRMSWRVFAYYAIIAWIVFFVCLVFYKIAYF